MRAAPAAREAPWHATSAALTNARARRPAADGLVFFVFYCYKALSAAKFDPRQYEAAISASSS